MFDGNCYLHVHPDGEDMKVEYDGDVRSLVVLINLAMNAIAKEIGVSYKEFSEAVVDDGMKFVKFMEDNGVTADIEDGK